MKSNQTKVKRYIQIEDLNHDEIQKSQKLFTKLDDKELSNIIGGLVAPEIPACPMGGALGKIICG